MIISDLVDARILVELRQCGSFAGTARVLKVPTTTVSRRIAKMEERAGLRLFERTSRKVCITEAGEVAAHQAQRMVAAAETAELTIDGLRAVPSGTVSISTPTIFGQALLAPAAAGFLAAYPECALEVDLSDRHVDLIEERFDAVVRVGPPENDEIIAKPLGTVFASLFCGPKAAGCANLDDLATCPVGLMHPGMSATPSLHITSPEGHVHEVSVQPRMIAMNPWLLLETAVRSDLVVVLPDIVAAPAVADGALRRVLPGWHTRRAPVHLAFTSRRLMRPAVRAFIDHMSDVMPGQLLP
ncbi:LysR substrate-binding domain-containing protein [uncultured Tateyamaria sp.]|uniref:LysR substrate-binding domain-containing protein n=1 Tax=uncultured Tateyamaria sp. TaxID=455651 RepID=UPI0026117A47|nr:LysR substrate-binding domain-containing protein [uncultured Tateyamaria sp.]